MGAGERVSQADLLSAGKVKPVAAPASDRRPARVHYIDWLRVLAVLVLIPFHTARIFDVWEPFYAKSLQESRFLTYAFIGAVNPWHMPLFFMVAGMSTWYALRFRTVGGYLKERFRRLFIPLVFGVLVVVAPQSYLGAVTYGHFQGSFFAYYPRFFRIGPGGGLEGYQGGFTPGHLWFVLFLFLFALAGVRVFRYLDEGAGRGWVDRLAAFVTRPGAIFLLAVPLLFFGALPGIGGKRLLYYFTVFVYGYLLLADERILAAVDRHKASALLVGLGLLGVEMVRLVSGVELAQVLLIPWWLVYQSLLTWSLLVAILGYGRKYLDFSARGLKYAAGIAYPFYILHQTAIVVIGYFVVRWEVALGVKFLVICGAATVAGGVLCEMVKLTPVTRVLFGVKGTRWGKAARR